MINKNTLCIILLIGGIIFLVTCTGVHKKQSESDKVVIPKNPANIERQDNIIKENRSIINAKVLGVFEIDEHRFYLSIKILEVDAIEGYANFARQGDEIELYPNYIRKEGQVDIDYSSIANKHMQEARTLKNGDIISANVYKTNNQNGIWSLVSWKK